MDNKNVIASSLTDNELAQAFSELVAERWDDWDLSPFMVYLVDVCSSNILPYLAEQFDVDGLRGFEVAANEQQQRDIIKRSIALHKFIGTPWAIREACRTVGFPVVILEEGVTAIPGGSASHEDWARFRVLIEASISRRITKEEARKLRSFVEFYKNERSHLVELGFFQPFSDKLFREEAIPHENCEIMFLSLNPNPVILNAIGTSQVVAVHSNVDWVINQQIFDWNDGSGDKLTLNFEGAAGHSEIMVTSDFYVRPEHPPQRAYNSSYSMAYSVPEDSYNRIIWIRVYAKNGKQMGLLTIVQRPGENNAYSKAYSNAHNLFKS